MKNLAVFSIALSLLLTACSSPAPDPVIEQPTVELPSPTDTPVPTPTLPPPPEQRMDQGDRAIFMGHYDLALDIFQNTLDEAVNETTRARSNLGIGQTYLMMGEHGASLSPLRTAANAEDPLIAARATYLLGDVLTKLQRYEEALAAFQTYLELQPGLIDERVHERRGDLYQTLGDYDQAITSYEAAIQSHPAGQSENLEIKIADVYQSKGDLETAISRYEAVYASSASDFTKATMALLIGRLYLELDQPEQGYAILQESVNNYEFAMDARTAIIILINDDVPVNELQRGLINFNFDNFPLAIEAFERYLAKDPEDEVDKALWYLGRAIREDGRMRDVDRNQEAINIWERLIVEHPVSDFYIDAWQSIAFTQWAFMGQPQQAAETALTYVAQRPESSPAPEMLFLAGRYYERADMLQEASDTWLRVGSEHPGSDEAFIASYFAGISLVRLNDWEDAQSLFSRALVLATLPADEAAAYLWLGKSQEALGDISAALDSWKLAQNANPFGHYSIRAEDLLMQREAFSEPESYTLDPDLEPYRGEAEAWLRTTFDLPPDTNLESPGMLAYDLRYQRGFEFWALGDYETAKAEFDAMRNEFSQDPAQTFRLIPALVEIGLYRSALAASTQLLRLAGLEGGAALSAPEFFSRIRFGAYYLDWLLPIAESEGISPLLLLSVMRQESAYDGFARSGAGASGLMQIMPDTGDQLAVELGWPPGFTRDDLYRPHVSLVLGTRYLKQRLQLLDGDIAAALAAYNGGIGNALIWKELNPTNDTDLFIEIVRLEETRNYIRLINEIHYIYGWLYGDPVPIE